jgi:diguanylate cyclase (GGDEF)-like protein
MTVNVAAIHQTVLAMRGMNRVGDILHAGLRSLHKGLDFDRVLLLDPEPGESSRLRGRLILDPTRIDVRRGPRSLVLPADPRGAIQRALDTGIPGRGHDADLDRWALERLGVDCFAVAPVRAGTANLGIVVADRFFVRRPIEDSDVAMLGLLCASLGLVVENMALDAQAKKLRSLAVMDELTGINNRRNLLLNLQREIERARRYGKPLSVVMIDVDHFKRWNDVHGHQVGDMVLQRVAQLVSSVSREIDSYGRYGGEEFMVVLPETPIEQGMIYAERLRAAVEQQGRQLREQFPDAQLTISIGVTSLAPTGDDLERVIQRADAALYGSKGQGRNLVSVLPAGSAVPEAQQPNSSPDTE